MYNVGMNTYFKDGKYYCSPRFKALQIILLSLIIIGIGLLLSQKLWVSKLVEYILKRDADYSYVPINPTLGTSTSPTYKNPVVKIPDPVNLPIIQRGTVSGFVKIGPTCPVVRFPEDPNCADKPYQTTLVIKSSVPGKGGGVLVSSDANGHFSTRLIPGTYIISSQNEAVMPRLAPVTFEVKAVKVTVLNIAFDSGIR